MKLLLFIAAGGAMGSMLRYGTSMAMAAWLGRGFPYGTLTVNTLGSLIMGFMFVMFAERHPHAGEMQALVLVGLLGGFTTFSSFSLETMRLLESGDAGRALLNVMANVLLCCVACWCGLQLARQLHS